MTSEKAPRGRRRVPLNELYSRWKGTGRALVEKHSQRSLHALYDEILAFLPEGIVDDASLAWFLVRYQSELEHMFHPPFAPAPTAAEVEEGENVHAALLEIGQAQHTAALVTIVQAKLAYHAAQMHAWKREGSKGAPPPEPGTDDDQWFERQVQVLQRFREAATGHDATQDATNRTQPHAMAQPGHRRPSTAADDAPAPEEMPDLGDETSDRPVGDGWADHVTWDGKEQTMSPRDMIRPHLEAIGRLDLLDQYDDEVIQYGPVVRRWIGGKLR